MPQTLGKGQKTLSNFFAECSTRRSAHGLSSTGEAGFAECLFSGTRQTFAVCQAALGKKKLKRDGRTGELANGTGRRKLCRVPEAWHSAKIQTSPSANLEALGEVWLFAECHTSGTRQRFKFRRVPIWQHSVKFGSLPSATRLALGKDSNFAECLSKCTRRNLFQ